MGFVTNREISTVEWRMGLLRLRLMRWLAGNDKVVINITLNEPGKGLIGQPEKGSALFVHNVSTYVDGHRYDFEKALEGS